MFNKRLGKGTKENNLSYQRKLQALFNTDDGRSALTWLIRTHIFNSPSLYGCTDLQHAYNNGKLDMIKLLITLTDFDFNIFEDIK